MEGERSGCATTARLVAPRRCGSGKGFDALLGAMVAALIAIRCCGRCDLLLQLLRFVVAVVAIRCCSRRCSAGCSGKGIDGAAAASVGGREAEGASGCEGRTVVEGRETVRVGLGETGRQ